MTDEGRYAVSARFVGVMRKAKSPEKMFVISTLWSDDKQINIYRTFEDFKKFHMVLKKKFSKESTLRKSTRFIPKFAAGSRKCSLQKGLTKAMCRLMFLEAYCKELLRGELIVTQSKELFDFFTPHEQDLNPNFTKNSSVVKRMDEQDDDGTGTQPRVWRVTAPFVTQTYRCVAGYDTKDIKNRDFRVSPDDELDVLIKESTGWWLVENEDKQVAWFPAPYLELCEEGQQEEEDEEAPEGTLFRSVRSYATKVQDEVSVPFGSVVEVLRKPDDGWWFIKHDGKTGYAPSMFLQPYNNPFGSDNAKKKKPKGASAKSAKPPKPDPKQAPAAAKPEPEEPASPPPDPEEAPPAAAEAEEAESPSDPEPDPELQKAESPDGPDAPKVSTESSTASLLGSGSLDSLDRRRSGSVSSSSSAVSSQPSEDSDGGYSTPDVCLISLLANNPNPSSGPAPSPHANGLHHPASSSDTSHDPGDPAPLADPSDPTPPADLSDKPLVDFSDLPLTDPSDAPLADPGDTPLADLSVTPSDP